MNQFIDSSGISIKDCPREVTAEEMSSLKTVIQKLALKTKGKASYKSVICMSEPYY